VHGFYWLIDGVLAGCARPGNRGGRHPAGAAALDDDLAWLRAQGVGALLSLTEEPLPNGAATRHGLDELHLPVNDLTAPAPAQLEQALAFIDRHAAQGQAVAVHCLMGQGRTGTVLAAYLIRGGHTAEAALAEVRACCPGAVGSSAQERALERWARERPWVI
jgi:atypical dual specificity phosphatase